MTEPMDLDVDDPPIPGGPTYAELRNAGIDLQVGRIQTRLDRIVADMTWWQRAALRAAGAVSRLIRGSHHDSQETP